jgi:hypothetical protein
LVLLLLTMLLLRTLEQPERAPPLLLLLPPPAPVQLLMLLRPLSLRLCGSGGVPRSWCKLLLLLMAEAGGSVSLS